MEVKKILVITNDDDVFSRLHFEFDAENVPFYAWFDKSLIEKVVFNLLSNAVKFTPDNGRIVLYLRRCQYQEIPESIRNVLSEEMPPEMEFAIIRVSDSGCGISQDELKHIFTPFYQVEGHLPTDVGTGLGLSLVYTIVKLHHGCINVDSERMKGSTFTVYIPVLSSAYSEGDIERGSSVAEEVIREKILLNTSDEIPHSVAVKIEKYQETDEIDRIYANIFCETKSQKGILIGKGGSMLKKIGTEARLELEKIVEKKVFLRLEVKVEKDWRKKENSLKNFGYEQEK